jgi:uncharacterized lipoprotein YmbA
MNAHRTTIGLPVAWLALLLAACQSAPTRVYTLEAVATSAPTAGYAGPAIRVDAVQVPPPWDRIELLRPTGRGEWRIDDLNEWGAPLGRLMRATLTADLMLRLPPERVIPPALPQPAGALGLRVDVLDFRADSHGARLDASWVLTSGIDSQAAAGTTHSAALEVPQALDGPAATAHALAELLGQLADAISAQLNAAAAGASSVAAPSDGAPSAGAPSAESH